jgi:acyl carrier protein
MTLNEVSAIKPKLLDIVAAVLELPSVSVTDALSSDNCDSWDSMRHLRLVLAVEDGFGVSFDEDEIATLTSVSALLNAIAGRLSS